MNNVYKIPTPVLISKSLYDVNSSCWKQQELRVIEVQKITKGQGAVLCFLDDGIGTNNEIGSLIVDRWTFLENVQPVGHHSTYGATVIAGRTIGIFPEMKLVSQQVLEPESGAGRSKEIVSAIYKAAEMGIETINLSLGSDSPDPEIEKALKYYCSNGINIATIAAGNDGPGRRTTDYPANYAKTIPGVLSIAATQIDKRGTISVAMFSSRGIISLGAPGHGLKSMDHNNILNFISGTSFATPIVGATIAVGRTLLKRPLYQDEILSLFHETSKKYIDIPENIGYGEISILHFLRAIIELPPHKVVKNKPLTAKGCGFIDLLTKKLFK